METFTNITTNNGNSSSSEDKVGLIVSLKSLCPYVLKDLQLKKRKKGEMYKT